MAQNYSLPKPTEPLLDQFGKVSVPWYNYLRTRFGDGAAGEIIASIEAQIADLIARVEALEEGDNAIISGPESVRVVGTLAGGLVQLTLEGDDRSPPPTYYYGTNALEVKGFHPVAETIIQDDGITLTVNADGTTNIAHADTSSVADISANFTGGTVPGEISFTFDQFGHVLTRTITGRTLDHNDTGALQGGSATERYHFTAAEHTGLLPWATEDPADYALITQTITNGDTTHAPSGDAVFDALARTKGYIDGLGLSWNGVASISVASGAAFIEGESQILESPTTLTKAGLSLSASTWYHVYLYDSGGTPDAEVVTTAPSAPYSGAARSKAGDSSRRYLGSVRTDASGNLINFSSVSGKVTYRHNFAANARVVSGGTSGSAATVSAASFLPPTSTRAAIRVVNSGAGGQVLTYCWDGTAFTLFGGATATAVVLFVDIDTDSSQQFQYSVLTTGVANIDIIGYYQER